MYFVEYFLVISIVFKWQPITATPVCDNDIFNANCEDGKVLAFDSANYGRTNSTVCKISKNTSCRLKETVAIMNRKCFGKKSCTLTVDDKTFKDPCPNTPKYLDASYTCTPVNTIHEACKQYMVNLKDSASGYIKSTNYPENYNERQDCVIKLKPRQGYKYDITLLDLDVENRVGKGCYDWLIIQDEKNVGKHFSFCGKLGDIHTDEPHHLEQMDNVAITFTSDSMTSHGGFIIKYQEVPAILRHEEF